MIVLTRHRPVLVDREALALITGRKVPTIRRHCVIVRRHYSGRALYALEVEVARLATIPTRRRDESEMAS